MHARKILADVSPEQPVIAQLEWGDFQVQQSGGRIMNPAGFYVSLVSGNVNPPANFETASQRKAREEEARRREEVRRAEEELEIEYEWYRTQEIDRFIATLNPTEVAAVLEAKRRENEGKYQTIWMINDLSERDAKRELGKRAPLISLEEFKTSRRNPGAVLSKPVSEASPEAQAAPVEAGISEPPKDPAPDLAGDSI
jgi:hypothetical protein